MPFTRGDFDISRRREPDAPIRCGGGNARIAGGRPTTHSRRRVSKGTLVARVSRLTHIGRRGEVRMVDISAKPITDRVAIAQGHVAMAPQTLEMVLAGDAKKGDVLGAARIAGIMGAKRTHELIPLCHPLPISKIALDIEPDREKSRINVRATVSITGKTGVEMEALTAV